MVRHYVSIFLFVALCTTTHASQPVKQAEQEKLPLVFSEKYDISFWGIEKYLHSFDSKKYGKIYNHLVKTVGIDPKRFYNPVMISDQDLLRIHTQSYLDSLNSSATIAQITEVFPLRYVPNFLLRWCVLEPMKYATAGTVLAAHLALSHGWAINLSGGYHHAKANSGEGFCVFNDIALAINKVHEIYPNHKILILDLDAHQGNGHEMICGPDERVKIFDVYNYRIYPGDAEAKKYIDFNYGVERHIKDKEYLDLLRIKLPEAIEQTAPDLIIYNAGTDIYEKDRFGGMHVSAQGIIQRDAFVLEYALARNIPIVMVLSGGYTPESHSIISTSIENFLKNIVHVVDATPMI